MTGVSIVAAETTKYGKTDLQARELAVEAAWETLESSGLAPDDLDAVFVANAFSVAERQGHLGPLVTTGLGIPNVPASTTEAACASASVALRHAIAHVKAGMADKALVVGTEKVTQIDTLTATSYFCYGSDYLLEGGMGATFPGLYAAMARAYLKDYGATEEDLAKVAIKNHKNAIGNEKAHLQKEITMEDVMDSYVVAAPLKLYDACPFSDGASACIVTRDEDARSITDTPVSIQASQQASSTASLVERDSFTSIPAARLASKAAYKQAGVTVDDIDVFQVHDCFTVAEIVATEDLGIFEPGEGFKAVRDGVTNRDGDRPVNVDGGLKAKGHPVGATGLGQVYEAFHQLRGEAGVSQVDGAERVLTHNVGATGGTVTVHVLGV